MPIIVIENPCDTNSVYRESKLCGLLQRTLLRYPKNHPSRVLFYRMSSNEKDALGYPKLLPRSPVPSDIEVSQDIVKLGLLPMQTLAENLGLEEDEYLPWGLHKSKVKLSVRDRLKDKPDGTSVSFWVYKSSHMYIFLPCFSALCQWVTSASQFPFAISGILGNYIVVTGINPTPLGEGKSTTTIGSCFSPK